MGLDAVVYCNCYETGRLKSPPPTGIEIIVAANGSIECANRSVEAAIALDAWTYNQACEHEDCVLLHHYLGNAGSVGHLRKALAQQAVRFPIILSKIVYSGIHAGDFLGLDDVRAVQAELTCVAGVNCENDEEQYFLDRFHMQMSELVECALDLKKPIAF